MGKMAGRTDRRSSDAYAAEISEMEMIESHRKKPRPLDATHVTPVSGDPSHFVSSDDILLPPNVLAVEPWTFPFAMVGWQQVMEKLRSDDSFQFEKTAGTEQKTATVRKQDSKSIAVVDTAPRGHHDDAESMSKKVFNQGRKRMAKRRLDLMERRMEREMVAQKRRSEEQLARLEQLHREQLLLQPEQHAQIRATLKHQQTMLFDLISFGALAQRKRRAVKICWL
ncbi:hypothetical protein PsorP6_007038 [Peronosclerospora sorghi]|uniref:Uncharacterized protein n=1 Tax=Peronosclerospora sorghi TaxID=230839 RepID=A0ACC0WDJ1_9STRA|nr:hypothetical protein PsorP6_007038 [Peronosclerospora sorghi]